jgi:RHS repeat-associated protein
MSGFSDMGDHELRPSPHLIPNQNGYAANGNLLNVTDSVTGQWNYTYDYLNRLKTGSATTSQTPGVSNAYAGIGATWAYDNFGNRTSEGWAWTPPFSGALAPNMPTPSSASYTAPTNQTGSLFYDAAGNVTADGLNQYAYDAEGRLCAVQTAGPSYTGYVYDAAGTRVAKGQINSLSCNFATNGFFSTAGLMQLGASYVLGTGGEQVTEYSVSAGASTWKHTNVFAGGQLLATYAAPNPAAPSTYFALNDWLGTKRVEVGAEGCASGYTSLQYGNGLNTVSVPGYSQCPVDATEQHFTGKERDTESGNDYFGARYYASTMGRFMSPDWSAKIEPIPYSKLGDPQTLNLYAYVGNNPMTRFDADGYELVKLGQHTDDQINARTKEINGELKDKSLSADDKASLKAEKNTLGIEKQGNSVIGGMLSKLDQTGQRNGLQVSDFTVSTSPGSDFAGKVNASQMSQIMGAQAFVLPGVHSIFVRTDLQSGFYQRSIGNSDFGYFGASALSHEQVHYNGQPHEQPAYARQRDVLNGFRTYYNDANLFRQQYNYIEKEANIP